MILDRAHQGLRNLFDKYYPAEKVTYQYPMYIGLPMYFVLLFGAFVCMFLLALLLILGWFENAIILLFFRVFSHRFFVSKDISDEVIDWCKENCKLYISFADYKGAEIHFFRKSDAILYKLTWVSE